MLIAIGYVSAADYYVAVGGAGAKDGSDWANAFDKIQNAVDACLSGSDTVRVADGTYKSVSNGGDQSYPININSKTGITIMGYGAQHEGPWLQGNGQSRIIVIESSSSIEVNNFKVSDGFASGDGGGILVRQTDGVLLRDLEITENKCQGEDTTYTGNGGGMAFDFSTVHVIGCCIWRNYALAHSDGWGGSGGAIALFNPDWDSSDLGYWIRDCCIFWNEADIAGGGLFLSGDDGYSEIENNLIRQNCVKTSGDIGAGIHCDCAKSYIKDNTVADNYFCEDARNHGGTPPKWGTFPDGSKPQTNVYGIWGCKTGTFWMRGIHNIVYFNGPPTFNDWNIWAPTITVRYSDVQMVAPNSPYPSTNNSNIDQDPLFEGEEDERPCNSTFYFLSENSPCVDAGIPAYTDAWGQGHCEFVNTTTGGGKDFRYSVHASTVEDKDVWCNDGNNYAGTSYRIDLGYHYDWYGMNYIELSSFTVEAYADKAVVRWATATEIDNAGFLVYRCDDEASGCSKVSGFIPATGAAASGAEYSFTDGNVVPGATYYYYLVDVDTAGKWTAHGPVVTRIPVRFARLPLLQLKAVEGLAARVR